MSAAKTAREFEFHFFDDWDKHIFPEGKATWTYEQQLQYHNLCQALTNVQDAQLFEEPVAQFLVQQGNLNTVMAMDQAADKVKEAMNTFDEISDEDIKSGIKRSLTDSRFKQEVMKICGKYNAGTKDFAQNIGNEVLSLVKGVYEKEKEWCKHFENHEKIITMIGQNNLKVNKLKDAPKMVGLANPTDIYHLYTESDFSHIPEVCNVYQFVQEHFPFLFNAQEDAKVEEGGEKPGATVETAPPAPPKADTAPPASTSDYSSLFSFDSDFLAEFAPKKEATAGDTFTETAKAAVKASGAPDVVKEGCKAILEDKGVAVAETSVLGGMTGILAGGLAGGLEALVGFAAGAAVGGAKGASKKEAELAKAVDNAAKVKAANDAAAKKVLAAQKAVEAEKAKNEAKAAEDAAKNKRKAPESAATAGSGRGAPKGVGRGGGRGVAAFKSIPMQPLRGPAITSDVEVDTEGPPRTRARGPAP